MPVLASAESVEGYEALRVLYDASLDRSVAIVLYGSQYGTGWFVAPHNDIVVTAAHVVGYRVGSSVLVLHGSWSSPGTVLAVDKERDIAVVRLERGWANAKPLPLCSEVVKGQEILVIGYPWQTVQVAGGIRQASDNPRAAFGVIAWVGGGDRWWLAEVHATTDHGNSGGPVVDLDTHCVAGVITFALKGSAGILYYATTSRAVAALLEQAGVEYEVSGSPLTASSLVGGVVAASLLDDILLIGLGALGLGAFLSMSRARRYIVLLPLVLTLALVPASAQSLGDVEDDQPQYISELPPGWAATIQLVFRYDMWVFGHDAHDTKVRIAGGGGVLEVRTYGSMPAFDPLWHAYVLITIDGVPVARFEIGNGSRGWGSGQATAQLVLRHLCHTGGFVARALSAGCTLAVTLYSTDGRVLFDTRLPTGCARLQLWGDDEARRGTSIYEHDPSCGSPPPRQGPVADQPPDRHQTYMVIALVGIGLLALIALLFLLRRG